MNTIYYPLKTIDSVPRFKHAILMRLNEWMLGDDPVDMMVAQGMRRHLYTSEAEGREDIIGKINYIIDTYENIEMMIADIDKKHVEYTNASIDRIRYMMNTDRSIKGKLVELLKRTEEERFFHRLQENLTVYQHAFLDINSLYDRVKRTVKTEGKLLPIEKTLPDQHLVSAFLHSVRKQYGTRKVDEFVERCFAGRTEFKTEEVNIASTGDFILFLLATMRGKERSADYEVKFADADGNENAFDRTEENVEIQGYGLPKAVFRKKKGRKDV